MIFFLLFASFSFSPCTGSLVSDSHLFSFVISISSRSSTSYLIIYILYILQTHPSTLYCNPRWSYLYVNCLLFLIPFIFVLLACFGGLPSSHAFSFLRCSLSYAMIVVYIFRSSTHNHIILHFSFSHYATWLCRISHDKLLSSFFLRS